MEKEIMGLLNQAYDDIEETRNKKVKEEEQKKQEMDDFLSRAFKNGQLVAKKILEKAIEESQEMSNYFSSSYCVHIPTIMDELIGDYSTIKYSERDLELMRIARSNGKNMIFCSLNPNIYIPVDIDMVCLENLKVDFNRSGFIFVNQSFLEELMSLYLEGQSCIKRIIDKDLLCKLQNSLKESEKIKSKIENHFKTLKDNAYLIYCQLLKGIIKDYVEQPNVSSELWYSKCIDYVDMNNYSGDTSRVSKYLSDDMGIDFVIDYNKRQRYLIKKSIMYFWYNDEKYIPAILDDIINISKANDGGIIDFYYIERDGVLNAETYSIYFIKLMNKTKEQSLEEEKATVKNTK